MIYLTLDEILRVAARVIDGEAVICDAGLLEAAVARPRCNHRHARHQWVVVDDDK